MEKKMELVDSDSVIQRFYYRYIHEPLQRAKERWLAYFANLARTDDDGGDQATDTIPVVEVKKSVGEPPKNAPEPRPEPLRRRGTTGPRATTRERTELSRFTFFTATLATVLGLGHPWRFPNVAYKMGGGAFLIIYCVLTLLFGYSLYFVELAAGQFASRGPLTVFKAVPLMQGLGYSMLAYTLIASTQYGQMIGLGVYYMAGSFHSRLPWSSCPGGKEGCLNSTQCHVLDHNLGPMEMRLDCHDKNITVKFPDICKDEKYQNKTKKECCPKAGPCPEFHLPSICRQRELPALYFWTASIERPTPAPPHGFLGAPDITLTLCFAAGWLLIYLLVVLGLKWTGLASVIVIPFLTAAFVIMVPLMVTEAGGVKGLMAYLVPRPKDFASSQIWIAAVQQALYSLAIAMGPLLALGSVCPFKRPCHVDPIPIIVAVLLTSLLSGSAVFSAAGHMAKLSGAAIHEVMSKVGVGTSFVAYSSIFSNFPLPWLFSATFFFLLVLLGAITVSGLLACISIDAVNSTNISKRDKLILDFALAFACFLLGLPLVMRGGIRVLEVFDSVVGGPVLPILSVLQLAAMYIYGLGTFCEDVAFMLGFYPNRFFRYTWMAWPIFPLAATTYFLVKFRFPAHPNWLDFLGLGTVGVIFAPIIVVLLRNVLAFAVVGKLGRLVIPPPERCPLDGETRLLRREFHKIKQIL